MKNNILKYLSRVTYLGILISTAFFTSCGDEDDVYIDNIIEQYLFISNDSYTFTADGTDAFTITVETSSDFTIGEPSENWVTINDDTTSVIFSASTNEYEDIRNASVVLTNKDGCTAVVNLRQLGQPAAIYPATGFVDLNHTNVTVMSVDGGYIAYSLVSQADQKYKVHLIDVQSGEDKIVASSNNSIDVCGVSNNGEIIFQSAGNNYHIDASGNSTLISAPLFTPSGYTFAVNGISPDGKVWAGYLAGPSSTYQPVVWTDGIPETVSVPAKDFFNETSVVNVFPRGGIASNGYISGIESQKGGIGVIKNGAFEYTFQDTIEAKELEITITYGGSPFMTEKLEATDYPTVGLGNFYMSGNGQYMALKYAITYLKLTEIAYEDILSGSVSPFDIVSSYYYPMIGVIETGEYKVLKDEKYAGYWGLCATDGILFATYMISTATLFDPDKPVCIAYDMYTETVTTAAEWVREKYGIIIPEGSIIMHVSADGKTLVGYRYALIGSYFPVYWYMHVE